MIGQTTPQPKFLLSYFARKKSMGIAYRSSFSSGHNIALFERDAAEVLNCTLYYVDGVELTYSRQS